MKGVLVICFHCFLALVLFIPGLSYCASFAEIVSSLEKLPREQRLQKQIEGAKNERKLLPIPQQRPRRVRNVAMLSRGSIRS